MTIINKISHIQSVSNFSFFSEYISNVAIRHWNDGAIFCGNCWQKLLKANFAEIGIRSSLKQLYIQIFNENST